MTDRTGADIARSATGHATPRPTPRPTPIDVVSIQSQVVYGRVGNNAAWPTLLAHGLNVAAVPTVVLSNTPHYPTMHGGALPLDWFEGYLEDLIARGALQHLRAILVGYLGNPGQVMATAGWIARIQALVPGVLVVVDPVLGDDDHGLYVAPGMLEAIGDHLLPLAHGLLPNGFELACLTGRTVTQVEQVYQAAQTLLAGQMQWIVVTSAAPRTWEAGQMRVAAITRDAQWTTSHRTLPISPKGTGDLFSATLTALLLENVPLAAAVQRSAQHVVAALERTQRAQCEELLLPVAALHADAGREQGQA